MCVSKWIGIRMFSLRGEQGVCHHYGLAIYIKKYLKAKEELWKFKYLTMQKYNLQKIPLKETKILQDISNLEFQHKSKYRLSKILI
jgi:hypothetical protein